MERMDFPAMLAYIKANPNHAAKRAGWEWARIVWSDRGPYRGDTFNRDMRSFFKDDDWLAEDWVPCDPKTGFKLGHDGQSTGAY